IGWPAGGFPKALQKIILDSAGEKPIKGRPGERMAKVDFNAMRKDMASRYRIEPREEDVLSYVLYPQVYGDFIKHAQKYDNTSVLPTPAFFYGLTSGQEITVEIEPGKNLIIKYLTSGEPREDGTRTIFFELNGQPREVVVADRSLEGNLHKHPQADPDDPNHVAAPIPGK